MLSSLLAIIGMVVIIYGLIKVRRINKERESMRKELQIVYTIGLKEYNKSLIQKTECKSNVLCYN